MLFLYTSLARILNYFNTLAMKYALQVIITVHLFFFISCNKKETSNTAPINNNISTSSIGIAGGSLLSVNNRVQITIPSNIFTTPTTVSIEKTNAPLPTNGIGAIYKILPEGATFSTPATIRFTYTDAELGNKSPYLLIAAFKNANGIWERISLKKSILDVANKSFSVTTNHFSEWVLIASEGGINVEVDGNLAYDINGNFQAGTYQGSTSISTKNNAWDCLFSIPTVINRTGVYNNNYYMRMTNLNIPRVDPPNVFPNVTNNTYGIGYADSTSQCTMQYGVISAPSSFVITYYGAVNDYVTGYFESNSVIRANTTSTACLASNYRYVPLTCWFQYKRLQ